MKSTCLTIAGVDNCAVAGIYTDLKTFHQLGCYGTAVITTITVQTIQKVIKIEPVKDELLDKQLSSLFTSFNIEAIKTGMIYKKSHFKIIKKYLMNFRIPTVIDPILYSTSGTSFIEKSAISNLIDLFSLASLITPNIPEALFLLKKNHTPTTLNELKKLGYEFFNQFRVPVLLKGGHFNSNENYIYDIFFDGEEFYVLKTKKIHKKHIRGTGCTLSAAIISFLIKKYSLKDSIHYAKKYLVNQIKKTVQYKRSDYYIILHE